MIFYLIGNEGSFLSYIEAAISSRTENLVVLETPEAIKKIDIFSKGEKPSVVIFIGGETLKNSAMYKKNYEEVKIIFDQCARNNIYMLYLSSLSVFGWSSSDTITTETPRNPLDVYGLSKNRFDKYVMESKYNNFCSLMPASIKSGKGRSSVEKMRSLYDKFYFLKLLRFSGCLSYVERETLVEKIVEYAQNKKQGFYIVSNHCNMSNFSYAKSLKIPRVPIIVFQVLSLVIGKRKSLLLRMIFRGVYYR